MRDSTANRAHRVEPLARWVALAASISAPAVGVLAGPDRASGASIEPPATKTGAGKPPPLPSDPAGERALLAAAGQGFRLRQTPHFVIAYDVSRRTFADLFSRLESTYYKVHRYCRVGGIPLRVSTSKLQVIFCDRWATYAQRAQEAGIDPVGTYGFYCQWRHRSAFYNIQHAPEVARLRAQVIGAKEDLERVERVLARLGPGTHRVRLTRRNGRSFDVTVREARDGLAQDRRRLRGLETKVARYVERWNQSVIQHEVSHHVLFAGGVHIRGADNPLWLVEGLATQFETPPARPGRAATSINRDRLAGFRQAHARGQLVPLGRLLSDPRLFSENSPDRAIFYAQAWALVYYLRRKESDRFAAYVRALAARRPGVSIAADHEQSEFSRIFGPTDGTFVSRWEKHILALPYRSGETGR